LGESVDSNGFLKNKKINKNKILKLKYNNLVSTGNVVAAFFL